MPCPIKLSFLFLSRRYDSHAVTIVTTVTSFTTVTALLMHVVFHAHPLAAGGVALERGFNKRHGSGAIHSGGKIFLAADALPARNDGIGKIPVQVAECFVVALGMSRRQAAGALGSVTQIRLAAT